MTKNSIKTILVLVPLLLAVAPLAASATTLDFEDLEEGYLGLPWTHLGVTFHSLNNVAGVFPDGSTFEPEPDQQCIIENATYFYGEFPAFGSPANALTFGISYIPGDNLSLGPLSTVTLDLDTPASALSFDIGYYENGPWSGIVYHLDALMGGEVVTSDSFTIAGSDPLDRDNPTFNSLAVSGVMFDQVKIYATLGSEYSMPRALIDNLVIETTVATDARSFGDVKALFK